MRSVCGGYLSTLSGCPQQVLEPQTHGEVETGAALDKVCVHEVGLPLQVEDLYNKLGKRECFKPIFHCDAKPFTLSTFASLNAKFFAKPHLRLVPNINPVSSGIWALVYFMHLQVYIRVPTDLTKYFPMTFPIPFLAFS